MRRPTIKDPLSVWCQIQRDQQWPIPNKFPSWIIQTFVPHRGPTSGSQRCPWLSWHFPWPRWRRSLWCQTGRDCRCRFGSTPALLQRPASRQCWRCVNPFRKQQERLREVMAGGTDCWQISPSWPLRGWLWYFPCTFLVMRSTLWYDCKWLWTYWALSPTVRVTRTFERTEYQFLIKKKEKNWNMRFTSVLTFQSVNIQSWGLRINLINCMIALFWHLEMKNLQLVSNTCKYAAAYLRQGVFWQFDLDESFSLVGDVISRSSGCGNL